MKSLRLLALSFAASLLLPLLAHAHPGHDGDHDFVWDFTHLAENPLATLACVSLLAAASWGAWRFLKTRTAAQTERAKRD